MFVDVNHTDGHIANCIICVLALDRCRKKKRNEKKHTLDIIIRAHVPSWATACLFKGGVCLAVNLYACTSAAGCLGDAASTRFF